MQGELDARWTIQATLVREAPDWIEKKLMDFHFVNEIPRGEDTLIPSSPGCRILNGLRNRRRTENFLPCIGPL